METGAPPSAPRNARHSTCEEGVDPTDNPLGIRREALTQLVWLKRDLRVRDHAPLVRASAARGVGVGL